MVRMALNLIKIQEILNKLYKDMLKNNLITFELAYWCKLHQ